MTWYFTSPVFSPHSKLVDSKNIEWFNCLSKEEYLQLYIHTYITWVPTYLAICLYNYLLFSFYICIYLCEPIVTSRLGLSRKLSHTADFFCISTYLYLSMHLSIYLLKLSIDIYYRPSRQVGPVKEVSSQIYICIYLADHTSIYLIPICIPICLSM